MIRLYRLWYFILRQILSFFTSFYISPKTKRYLFWVRDQLNWCPKEDLFKSKCRKFNHLILFQLSKKKKKVSLSCFHANSRLKNYRSKNTKFGKKKKITNHNRARQNRYQLDHPFWSSQIGRAYPFNSFSKLITPAKTKFAMTN